MSEISNIICDVCEASHEKTWADADGWAKVELRAQMLPRCEAMDLCPSCASKVAKVLGILMPAPYSEQR